MNKSFNLSSKQCNIVKFNHSWLFLFQLSVSQHIVTSRKLFKMPKTLNTWTKYINF